MCELATAKGRAERLDAKVQKIKELIEQAKSDNKELIEVRLLILKGLMIYSCPL